MRHHAEAALADARNALAGIPIPPAAAPCPKCDTRGNMQYQWKPDGEPERERLRCYRCGWDTGWIRYGTCSATLTGLRKHDDDLRRTLIRMYAAEAALADARNALARIAAAGEGVPDWRSMSDLAREVLARLDGGRDE